MFIRRRMCSDAWRLIGILLLAVPAFARPDFTGVWVRDAAGSDPNTAVVAPLIGGGRDTAGRNLILRINHRGKNLQIAIEQASHKPVTATYNLGRGWHGNVGYEYGGSRYRSKWKDDTLAIERYASYRDYDGSIGGTAYQEWTLSHGGAVLTITTTTGPQTMSLMDRRTNNPMPGVVTIKEVFRKK